jgi:Xaa-Pro aminopeptidase
MSAPTEDWVAQVDDVAAVYAARAAKAVAAMAQADVQHAAFVSSGRHLFTDMDPVVWLTGFKPMRSAAAVVDPEGRVTLFTEGAWEAERAVRVATAEVVAVAAPFVSAAEALTGRDEAHLGGAGLRKLNTVEHRQVTDAGRLTLRSFDIELDSQARSKDELELAQFRRASEIAELAFDVVRSELGVGMTDVDVEAMIERVLRELGADDAFVFLSASTRNRAVQRPWGRVLMPGDILLTELSPCVGSVFSQICRTVVFGEPAKEVVHDHELLVHAMEAGVAEIRPGVTVSEVVSAMDAPLIARGLEQYTQPPFMRVRGHGMGFGSVAPGDFVRRNTLELVAGDTFVLHPNQMLPGAGYLMCGEPMTVTAAGGEITTRAIAGLEIVEA